jgi:phosphoribosylaminoimidazole-succinocarboxamide synthase
MNYWPGTRMSATLPQSDIRSLPFLHRGKVRDIYAVGDDKLLVVQTDRLSAFDVILPDPIPGKGEVLTTMSNFWLNKLQHVIPNHLTGIAPESVVKTDAERAQVRGRAFVAKKLKPLPIEAIVRGYLIGSGWKDYQKTGTVCGIALPDGLREAEKLPKPCSRRPPRRQWAITTKIFRLLKRSNYSVKRALMRCAMSRWRSISKRQIMRRPRASSLPIPSLNLAWMRRASCI